MKKSLECGVLLLFLAAPSWSHDHRADAFVAPLVAPAQATTTVYTVPATSSAATAASIDRLLIGLETTEELRRLLSSPERLRQLADDPVARQFLRERLTAAEVAATAGVSPTYLDWLYETLVVYGDRLDPTVIIPNFRLVPAQSVPTFQQILSRWNVVNTMGISSPVAISSAGITATWQARVVTQHPHAHIHSGPYAAAPKIARPPAGSIVTVVAESGDWYMVKLSNGQTGYGHKYELDRMPSEATMLVRMEQTVTSGYDTPYGWVYPRYR